MKVFGGVGEDDGVGGTGAAGEGGAEVEGLLGGCVDDVGIDVEDGDAAAAAVGDDEGAAVGGDTGQAGLFAGAGDGDLAAVIEVEDGDSVGAGVGDEGAVAGRGRRR